MNVCETSEQTQKFINYNPQDDHCVSDTLTETGEKGQGVTFKRMAWPQEMPKTGQNQIGPRWQKIVLPVDLEPHYTHIVIISI